MALDAALVQRRLRDRGFAVAVDGAMGAESFAALLAVVAGAAPGPRAITAMRRAIGAALVRYLPAAEIDRPLRLAHFLAQAAVETGGFRALVESLNYTPDALLTTFNTASIRITSHDARRLGRQTGEATVPMARQQEIANIVYGDDFGARQLGNTQPGDGWRFRGRGIKQTTGRANYRSFRDVTGLDVLADPDQLGDPDTGVRAGCVFWQARRCNPIADADDIVKLTETINGGHNGLRDRRAALVRAKAVLVSG